MFSSSLTFWFVSTVILGSNPSFAVASLRGNNSIYHPEEQASRVLETTVEATYLIKDESREYGRDLQVNPHEQTASLELPDGRIYEVYNAPSQWEKSLKSGRDKVGIPAGSVFSSDGTVNVKGKNLSKINKLKNGFVRRNLLGDDAEPHEQEHNLDALQFSRKLQTGTRRVLAVRVIVNDGTYSHADQTGLSNDVFGNGIDPVNLKSQYAACSYNQLVFEKSLDRNLSTTITPNIGDTAISNGVVDIRVNHNKTAGDGTIVNAVTTEINRVFGVTNPNQLANHVMYCLPSGVMSGIAYAYINSWNSVYSNQWCNYLSGQMHEVS